MVNAEFVTARNNSHFHSPIGFLRHVERFVRLAPIEKTTIDGMNAKSHVIIRAKSACSYRVLATLHLHWICDFRKKEQ
jgi:hypothetical protein